MRRGVVVALAALLGMMPAVGRGQTASPLDAGPRRLRFDPTLLHPGQFVYEITLERDAGTSIVGTRTVTSTMTTYAGSPAWLLLENRTGEVAAYTDSLFTDLSLNPLHWGSLLGGARLVAEFRADTVFGATSAPSGRRSMIGAIPPGALVSSAMLETVLRLLPFQTTWEDSAAVLSVTPGSNTVMPTRLAVIGEDRVRVPAGTFDCWVVSVRADPGRSLYWVTKRDPIVVRSAMDVPSLGTAQLIYSLTRIGR